MAYTDTQGTRPRIAVALAVTAVEAAAVLALIHGLSVYWTKPEPVPNPEATNFTLPKPKTPEKPRILPREPATARLPDIPKTPLGPVAGPELPNVGDPGMPYADPAPPLPIPQPSPTFRYAIKAPSPRNNPANWVSERDYPASDLRQGNQGRVAFALEVGAVAGCRVTVSSGFPGLDAAACALVSRRARFNPAVGPDGDKVPGTYSGSIRWVIPD